MPTPAISAVTFSQTARRGASRTASHGEQVANRLARALHHLGDDLALVDLEALEGACELIRLLHGPWQTDEEKAAITDLVAHAAGK